MTTKQEILNYLDNVIHPIVSPDNWNVYSELHDMIEELPLVEPVKNGLVADFVDTAEKAAKVEIMSEKDAQATSDAWKMFNRMLETEHEKQKYNKRNG